MTSRDEYLAKFKTKLDEWDAEIDRLEAKAREARAEGEVYYRKQLAQMREMRDEAMGRYGEMQDAAADAWDSLAEGTERAWTSWLSAFEEARDKFTGVDKKD